MFTELVIKMNDDNILNGFESKEKALDPATGNAGARRRLLKRGASAVVITMASRPVLAWHCKSPSVVASEALNPNTSLAQKNASKRIWADETWGLKEWKGNVVRTSDGNSVTEWWEASKPWSVFLQRASLSIPYQNVKLGHLTATGISPPAGMGTMSAVQFLSSSSVTEWKKRVLVAQLNLFTLTGPNSGWLSNDLDNCVTMDQLNQMATGSYVVAGQTWGSSQISSYLYNNWMAR